VVPESTATLGATHLDTTDLQLSRRLFVDVLGAEAVDQDRGLEVRWPSGALRVRESDTPGVSAVDVVGRSALLRDLTGKGRHR
jgi:hypothetical protein